MKPGEAMKRDAPDQAHPAQARPAAVEPATHRAPDQEMTGEAARVREAQEAFREFDPDCFWYCRKDLTIGPGDVQWVAETLRKYGDMRAWRVAGRLCR